MLRLKEPHRIDEPGQFDRSGSSGPALRGDLCLRCTGGSLKVTGPIDPLRRAGAALALGAKRECPKAVV